MMDLGNSYFLQLDVVGNDLTATVFDREGARNCSLSITQIPASADRPSKPVWQVCPVYPMAA